MAKKDSINASDMDILRSYLSQAGNTALSALKTSRAGMADTDVHDTVERLVAIEAMLEKSGYLIDKALSLVGDPGIVGNYDDWLAGERMDADDRAGRQDFGDYPRAV